MGPQGLAEIGAWDCENLGQGRLTWLTAQLGLQGSDCAGVRGENLTREYKWGGARKWWELL